MNVKSIAISPPGSGFTTMEFDRKIANWPATDVDPVLEKEGVGKFAVEGSSLGSPHALAVVHHYGPERVTTLAINIPFLPRPVSDELGLKIGQPETPSDTPFMHFLVKTMMSKPSETLLSQGSSTIMSIMKVVKPEHAAMQRWNLG